MAVYGVVSYFLGKRTLDRAWNEVADYLGDIFEKRPVKQAMSIMGKASGEAKRNKSLMGNIATNILDNPQVKGLKLAGKAIGIDIDTLIEEHGPVEVLSALKGLGDVIGIDVMQLLSKGLNLTPDRGSGGSESSNPYLGGL